MNNLADQRIRDNIASDFNTSYFVEASAGAGKTHCLVERMVWLMLKKKVKPANIVAITFTNKAAQEFKERVEARIAELHKVPETLTPQEQEHLQVIIHELDQCYMGTIHSFCLQILKEHPVEAGLDLSFTSMDETENSSFMELFWNNYVRLYENQDPDLMKLIRMGVNLPTLKPVFEKMNQVRDLMPFPLLLEHETSPDPWAWPAHIDVMRNTVWDAYDELRAKNYVKTDNDTNLKRVAVLDECNAQRKQHGYVSEMNELKILKSEGKNKKRLIQALGLVAPGNVDKTQKQDRVDLEKRLRNDWSDADFDAWEDALARRVNDQASITLSKMVLLAWEEREKRGKLDFQDLLMYTHRMLQENPEICRRVKKKYQYFFIDEFQDTDPLQISIIKNLVDFQQRPESVFIVGDKKQSIYRFNRADVINFNTTKKELGEKANLVDLTSNFRTVPVLCQWFNQMFSQLLPATTEAEDMSQAAYTPIFTARNEELSTDDAARCLEGAYRYIFSGFDPEDTKPSKERTRADQDETKEQFREREAHHVARLVLQLKQHKVLMMKKGRIRILQKGEEASFDAAGIRPLEYKDIMALTMNKTGMAVYNKVFQSYGIPVVVDGETRMSDSWAARELLKILKALENPYEALYMVAALRSPLFGLSDRQLYDYNLLPSNKSSRWSCVKPSLSGRLQTRHQQTMPRIKATGKFSKTKVRGSRKCMDSLKATLKSKQGVTRVKDRLHRYHQWAAIHSPITLLEKIIEDIQLLPVSYMIEKNHSSVHILYQLCEILRQQEIEGKILTINDLVTSINAFQDKFANRQISLEKETNALRLMNLHKAKGLEAPVVILLCNHDNIRKSEPNYHVSRQVQKNTDTAQVYFQYRKEVPGQAPKDYIRPMEDWKEHFRREHDLLKEEHLRKIYVGFTRAENLLLLGEPLQDNEVRMKELKEPAWINCLSESNLLESIPFFSMEDISQTTGIEEENNKEMDHQEALARIKDRREALKQITRIRRVNATPSTLVLPYKKGGQTILKEVLAQREKAFSSQQQEETSLEETLDSIYKKALDKLFSRRQWPADLELRAAFGDDPQPRPARETLHQWLENQVAETEEITGQDNPYSNLWGTLVHGLMEKMVLRRQLLKSLTDEVLAENLHRLATEVLGNTLTEDILQGKTFRRMYRQLMGLTTEDELEAMDMDKALNTLLDKLVDAGLNLIQNNQPQQKSSVANLWQDIREATEVYPEMPFSLLVTQGHPLFQLWKDTQQKNGGESDAESVEEVLFTGIMDLVYCHQGQWKIVDYKTNREKQGVDLHQVYANQLKAYHLAWKEMEGSEAQVLVWRV